MLTNYLIYELLWSLVIMIGRLVIHVGVLMRSILSLHRPPYTYMHAIFNKRPQTEIVYVYMCIRGHVLVTANVYVRVHVHVHVHVHISVYK